MREAEHVGSSRKFEDWCVFEYKLSRYHWAWTSSALWQYLVFFLHRTTLAMLCDANLLPLSSWITTNHSIWLADGRLMSSYQPSFGKTYSKGELRQSLLQFEQIVLLVLAFNALLLCAVWFYAWTLSTLRLRRTRNGSVGHGDIPKG